MSELNKKIEAFESKNKKTNRGFVFIIALGLIVFVGLYLNNIKVQNQKIMDESIYLKQQVLEAQKLDSLEYVYKQRKSDSIKKVLDKFQIQIEEIKIAAIGNNKILEKIDSLEGNVNTIIIAADTIIVRYYKRKADSNIVENVFKNIKYPNYYLQHRKVYNDDGSNTVNTLYYGENVKRDYVDFLYKKLIKNGIKIKEPKLFISAKGFEWKKNAMEIGFERPTSQTEANAQLFVRLYCYRPDKKVKEQIENKLEAKGYQVKVFPDWKEKPSFFSNETTLLYYNKLNQEKAKKMAETLSKLTGIKVLTSMGAGYGVTEDEKAVLYIIHYNGSYRRVKARFVNSSQLLDKTSK